MSAEFFNAIATIAGIIVAVIGAFIFAFWVAMGIWTFNDIRQRTRDWLAIVLAILLVIVFPIVGWVLYLMIRPRATLADVYDRALEEEALLREMEETLACGACGVPVKDNWVYCPNCHQQLQHTCPGCANLVRNDWAICVYCGAPQPRAVAPQRNAIPETAYVQAAPQSLPQSTMPTQPQPQVQPAAYSSPATRRAARNPFAREAGAQPSGASDIDDTYYQPARPGESTQPGI